MSNIVLSASVRQNLLSLQSTADLLATTQNRLSTGNKVNSALDNPTNYFTAAALNNRASDITNLLDGVGNGVQVLQAANTGITSLQKLVDSAKSVAQQVLQSAVGYSAKSSVSTTIEGATAANIIGGTPATNANVVGDNALTGFTVAGGSTATITINGTDIVFNPTDATTSKSYSVDDVLSAINAQSGTTNVAASLVGGRLSLTSTAPAGASDTAFTLAFGGTAGADSTIFGFTSATPTVTDGADAAGGLNGLELTIGKTGDDGAPLDIFFGTGTGQVKSLNDLNTVLSANNLLASIDVHGKLTITTTNDAASATIGDLGGSATEPVTGPPAGPAVFAAGPGAAPVLDPGAQAVRANLVTQYNNILDQITTTAQDSSYNGIDLLNGDQLKLTFNETGTSTLKIQGVSFDYKGLGLSKLSSGIDFLDNSSANAALKSLGDASGALRTQASTLGSNLSIVQIRQDFSKNLINVLQTGSSNLTLADTNEEAANSQALATRQSIAVSALALANQSQQSVLQLLR